MSRFLKRLFLINLALAFIVFLSGLGYLYYTYSTLPQLITVADYKPLLSSDIYARGGEKIGELYSSKQGVRILTPYEDIPPLLSKAFLAAEDDSFFEHKGFNIMAILRAIWINTISGKRSQGASTITQQTARTLFLSSEKTYLRKIKEALLTYKMESNLPKEDILYLYLNQIYLGQGAYGVAAAAETYYRKKLKDLTLAEMALLAGVPTSPSRFNPVVNPKRAKERQLYVLHRMATEGFATEEETKKAGEEVLKIQGKKIYKEIGPYFVETVRQLLVKELGEDMLLEQGLKIYTSLDLKAQVKAIETVNAGLRSIDKKRGYRGAKSQVSLEDTEAVDKFLTATRESLIKEKNSTLYLKADGTLETFEPFAEIKKKSKETTNIPPYIEINEIVEGLVTKVDDTAGIVYVRFAESQGILPLGEMLWARPFNPDLHPGEHLNIKRPSQALKPGDVIDVKVLANIFVPTKPSAKSKIPTAQYKDFASLSLEQLPEVQSALLSFDLDTGDITAMIGGLDYSKNKFNRTYQALRQTGSAFKPIVYAAGIEQGLTLATPIMGAPIVYGAKTEDEKKAAKDITEQESDEAWKPGNFDGKFTGDVLMRTALKRSLNTPTIRVLEKATIPYAASYARRLGIFSPLNMDLSLALGSSGVSLYEMNKAMAIFARNGKRFSPIIVREVKNKDGEVIIKNLSLDQRFKEKLDALELEFEERRAEYRKALAAYQQKGSSAPSAGEGDDGVKEKPPVNGFFFDNPNQLISPQTAYLVTNMLQGVATEPDGTGGKAAALGRPVAGKTGTTNGYYDAWFLGYTPQIATSVWVGLDTEKTLGKGQTGGDSALPIWLQYMQYVHEPLPVKNFEMPANISFFMVDKDTGKPLTSGGIMLPFVQGTEPSSSARTYEEKQVEEKDFLRESF
jgi:penicillin-binding protein 1A